MKEPRSWQKDAFKIIERCNSNEGHNAIPVNACVGSGKTDVASYALGDFIVRNLDKKTIQMFVTPRIRLCKQQAKEIGDYIKDRFNLTAGVDYAIIRKDCSISEDRLDLLSDTFAHKHAIIVACDESVWGTDDKKENPDQRWCNWMHFFSKRAEQGFMFGNCVFDEAHNFTNENERIFGKEAKNA